MDPHSQISSDELNYSWCDWLSPSAHLLSDIADNTTDECELNYSSSDLSDRWRDWSGLPAHLLSDIADNITDLDDYVSFGRVCTSWQTIFLQNMKSLGSPLLLTDPLERKDYHSHRALYSPSKKSVCNLKVPLPRNKNCRGSSFGWLITLEVKGNDSYHVQLLNPFLSRTINLPTLDNIAHQLRPDHGCGVLPYGEYLWKATLSSDPSVSNDFIVMATVSRFNGLAYFKPGNDCWVPIGDKWSLESDTRFEDVIFHHKTRQFYSIRRCGTLIAIRFCEEKQDPDLIQVAPPLAASIYTVIKCLVEDLESGDLLLVCRKRRYSDIDQNGKKHIIPIFLVFRLNPLEQSWSQIHDLGGKVLFVGPTSSALRSISDCPGCLPDCIYFNSHAYMALYDPKEFHRHVVDGMYRLVDDTVQADYYLEKPYKKAVSQTVWLEPTTLHQGVRFGCMSPEAS